MAQQQTKPQNRKHVNVQSSESVGNEDILSSFNGVVAPVSAGHEESAEVEDFEEEKLCYDSL